ncbi:LY6E protein, partial [Scytalopus superciliaris]|nr:LY6E protein [Scytalopus superciliaris]
SLTCFSCKDATSNIHCLSTTKCSDNEKYCLTTYSTTGTGKCGAFSKALMARWGSGSDQSQRITKKCSAFCPTIDLNIGIAGVATSCCKTSLCNISGASSVRTSSTMIALGLLASLACILRMGF